jgi:UDP-N-acetylglucosamine acyltransferase
MIHPTALIAPTAILAPDVTVGPFAIIEDGVVLGEGCRVLGHAQVLTGVVMGARNTVDRGAIIGGDPQSLTFDRTIRSGVRIGSDNTFREHVTIHRSTQPEGETLIGDGNFLMAHCHIGHDSRLGDQNVIANAVLIAGHVQVGNRCFLGGSSVFHQFIRLGDLVMAQGNSSFSTDVAPYCIGHEVNKLAGLNTVGLRRAGLDSAARQELKRLYRDVFSHALGPVKAATQFLTETTSESGRRFLEFLAAPGSKGLSTPGTG